MDARVLRRELAAIGLILFAVFLTGALVFQRVPENGTCLDATGVFGPAGTWVRCGLVTTVGIPGASLVALGSLIFALTLFGRLRREDEDAREWAVLLAGVVALTPVAVGLALGGEPSANDATGLWGSFAAHYLRKGFGAAGAWIFFVLAASALTVVTLRWNPIRMVIGSGCSLPSSPNSITGSRITSARGFRPFLSAPRPEASATSASSFAESRSTSRASAGSIAGISSGGGASRSASVGVDGGVMLRLLRSSYDIAFESAFVSRAQPRPISVRIGVQRNVTTVSALAAKAKKIHAPAAPKPFRK